MRLLCCFAMSASVSALRGALGQSVGGVKRSVSRRALSNLSNPETSQAKPCALAKMQIQPYLFSARRLSFGGALLASSTVRSRLAQESIRSHDCDSSRKVAAS